LQIQTPPFFIFRESSRGSVSFTDIVPVPIRNGDDDIAFHYGLATEPGIELEISGLLDAVHFVVFHFGKIFHALFHDDVTGGAGAASSAGVLEVEVVVHGDIEKGFRLAVFFVGQLAGFEFESLSRGEKGYLGHLSDCSGLTA